MIKWLHKFLEMVSPEFWWYNLQMISRRPQDAHTSTLRICIITCTICSLAFYCAKIDANFADFNPSLSLSIALFLSLPARNCQIAWNNLRIREKHRNIVIHSCYCLPLYFPPSHFIENFNFFKKIFQNSNLPLNLGKISKNFTLKTWKKKRYFHYRYYSANAGEQTYYYFILSQIILFFACIRCKCNKWLIVVIWEADHMSK